MESTNNSIKVLMVSSVWPSENEPGLVPFLVEQVQSLHEGGIDIEVFSFYGKGNPIRYLWYWLKFHVKCALQDYDIIHAQFGQSGLIVLPTKLPLVVTFHGSDLQGWIGLAGKKSFASKIMTKMSRIVAHYSDQIIVVSDHLTNYLPSNLSVNRIPCGINFDLFHPLPRDETRSELNLPLEKYLILFVGDPSNPIKRFELAQQAVESFGDYIDSQLIIAKDIPHEIMPQYLNACDVLLVTSVHEGSPTVVKEALACNLPVVSVDVGDVKQRVGDFDECIVCEEDSINNIVSALCLNMEKGRLKDGFSKIQDLSLENISNEIINVYQAAISD